MVLFIAEICSNHAKNINRCFDFIDKAAEIGCDVVKFQLFRIDQLFSKEAMKQKPFILDRRQWELPLSFLPLLAERCQEKNIQFSCTPFYLDAVDELKPYVSFYKIASYALLWDALLAKCAKTDKPVILSTGMATMDEISHAVQILRENYCQDITLLHCTSSYPTPPDEANLAAIETLRMATQCRVGWSDHTAKPGVIHRAIHKWGAEIIEFHLDLDKTGAEYAMGHCWLPEQIASVIKEIRYCSMADGSGIKGPTQSELIERQWRTDPFDGLRPLLSARTMI